MKTQNAIKKFYSGDLYSLCNKEQFFTSGDNTQYGKFFAACEKGVTLKELAIMLYMCSKQNEEYILAVCESFFESHGTEAAV